MLSAFTIFHVILSLVGIASGFVVLYGLLNSKPGSAATATFLSTTVLTSVTGFLFPFHGFTPAIGVGILSLILLAFAILALYRYHLSGGWRKAYVITALASLYLNVFVLVVQSFQKIPVLRELAPTQTEAPFQIAQLVVLLAFVILGYRAVSRFRADLVRPA